MLREIARHSRITATEEAELVQRWRRERLPEARSRLVAGNLRLVLAVARRFASARHDLLDLVQEGCIGLLRAVDAYDPTRGVKFGTYAYHAVRAAMLTHVRDSQPIRIVAGTHGRRLFYALRREQARSHAATASATHGAIGARLGVPEDEVAEMDERLRISFSSLQVGGGASRALAAEVEDPETAATRAVDGMRLRRRIEEVAGSLDARSRAIVLERIAAETPLPLSILARRFGVTPQRVMQLEQRARAQLLAELRAIHVPVPV